MPTKRKAPTTTRRNDSLARVDGWKNLLTGLGDEAKDASENTTYSARAQLSSVTKDQLYTQNSLLAKIVDRPAWDATREWIEISFDNDEEPAEEYVLERMEELCIQEGITRGLTWASLYGGAIGVLGMADGADLEKPLADDAQNEIVSFEVFDRHQVRPLGVVASATGKQNGMPEFYEIIPAISVNSAKQVKVHWTRCVRFDGVEVPDRVRAANEGWHWSNVDRIYTDLRSFQASMSYLANILKEANIDVFQVSNLADILQKNKSKELSDRFRMISMCKSILGGVVIGSEEKYERRSVVLSGIVELLREFKETLSASADIPTTILWGRSPAGMNATGESDILQYYDRIKGVQRTKIARPLRRIANIISNEPGSKSKGAKCKISFCPLWQMTDKEKAEIYSLNSNADKVNIDSGVLDPVEVAMSRFGENKGDIRISESLRREALEMLQLIEAAPVDETATVVPELGAGDPTGGEAKAADEVLNGAQLAQVEAMKLQVATRQQPRETAIAALVSLYNRSEKEAESLMGEIGRTFFVQAAEPAPAFGGAKETPAEGDPNAEA